MSNTYLHSGKTIKSIKLLYFSLCIPLILFGFYKNGIYVYLKSNINILQMISPLVLPFVCYYLLILIIRLGKDKIKINKSEEELYPLYGLLIGMLLPININMLLVFVLFPILTIIYFIVSRKIKFNYIAFTLLIIIASNYLLFNTSLSDLFLNTYEKTMPLDYTIYKQIFGFNYSGMAVTSVFLIIVFSVVAHIYSNFKVSIPLSIISTYFVIGILLLLISNNYPIINNLVNYSNVFLIFFVATENFSSPYTKSGMIAYGILIGVFYYLFAFISPVFGFLISIFLVSFLCPILNIMFRKTK